MEIKERVDGLSLEAKVGQCLTFSWRGSLITPAIEETITRLHCGGLRIEPFTTESARSKYYGKTLKDDSFEAPRDYFDIAETYFTAKCPAPWVGPGDYAERLNRLQELATSRESGLPLHVCLDNEASIYNDYPFGMLGFPTQMGLAASGDPDLAYRVGRAIGRQLSSVGITMLHSPVCDVNNNPKNPEIRNRAFSDDPETCAEFAVAYARGIQDGGLVAVAKHFPGRGDSVKDAHFGLEVIDVARERMHAVELKPYKRLIAEGVLQAVMSAHSVFPCYEKEGRPSTLSPEVIRGLLREELGFDGVITTDAMGMGAIVEKWGVPRACVLALKAGVDLLLVKSDDAVKAQCFFAVKSAVESGELSEEVLDASVARILEMKSQQGLLDRGGRVDAEEAGAPSRDADAVRLADDSAVKALTLLRDRATSLPLTTDQKVLVIEQLRPVEFVANDLENHMHRFNEAMLRHSRNVINADCAFVAEDEEIAFLTELAGKADAVVVTNFYWRIVANANVRLVKALAESGKPVIVVTNDPYEAGCPPEADVVVSTFSTMPASLEAAAAFLYGKGPAGGQLPVRNAPDAE